jgi:formylglycine-generating enzyme required for sulfatase activity
MHPLRALSLSSLAAGLAWALLAQPLQAGESPAFADKVVKEHGLDGTQAERMRTLLTKTPGLTRNIGTEDPKVFVGPNNSYHPVTREKCRTQVLEAGKLKASSSNERTCGAKWMAPLPGPDGKTSSCIDQFEFPNIPCEYPVVWVPSYYAQQICQSMGKRLCNAHEWEGACAGKMESTASYRFDIGDPNARRAAINANRKKVWAFQDKHPGRTDAAIICGVYSAKDKDVEPQAAANIQDGSIPGLSKGCAPDKSAFKTCGTNTWPSGYKYECTSNLGVYDMHGNLAEVVNLPTSTANIAKGNVTGMTERKGSFFVDRGGLKLKSGEQRYPDDCRVRQPYEHMKPISEDKGHAFYQEGFRCCKDLP